MLKSANRKPAQICLLATCAVLYVMASCAVPVDDDRRDARIYAARGAVRGSFRYQGPPPCSSAGRIVGTGIVLVWDIANPPPPLGRATRPVNFVAIPGDSLFPDRPRYKGTDGLSCPDESESVLASAPFAISPLEPGAYYLTAFYNRSGNYLPSFPIRNQPEAGDILGGYLDAADQITRGDDPNYQPRLLKVDIGYQDPVPPGQPPGFIPNYRIPSTGFVASSIPVTVAQRTALARPYFHIADARNPAAAPEPTPQNPNADPGWVPIVRMTQDHQVLAPATRLTPATLLALEKSYVALRLEHGMPAEEIDTAIDPQQPFVFQLAPPAAPKTDGFAVFLRASASPESLSIPALWPAIGFAKLIDDPGHLRDPQGTRLQANPRVLLSAISLLDDALANTTDAQAPKRPLLPRDHVRALVRPAAICYAPNRNAIPGIVVAPHTLGASADAAEPGNRPVLDTARLLAATQGLASEFRQACLPLGRYAISAGYPTGQQWSTPNEAGSCAATEGVLVGERCSVKRREVLASQGPRAVLEIVPPTTEAGRTFCAGAGAVPAECLAP